MARCWVELLGRGAEWESARAAPALGVRGPVVRAGGHGKDVTSQMNNLGLNQLGNLEAAHSALELELQALGRRPHMTPTEEQRAKFLKKQKLRTKDRIRVLRMQAQRSG